MNLVLSNTIEVIGVEQKTEVTRNLGLIIVKGSQIQCISLRNGYTIIDNPFIGGEEEEGEQGEGEEAEEEEEEGQKGG